MAASENNIYGLGLSASCFIYNVTNGEFVSGYKDGEYFATVDIGTLSSSDFILLGGNIHGCNVALSSSSTSFVPSTNVKFTSISCDGGTTALINDYTFSFSKSSYTSNIYPVGELVIISKSIDCSTLSGWSTLSSGTHSITLHASASGYRDSADSTAVSVTKI